LDVSDCTPRQLRARLIGAVRAAIYRARRHRRIDPEAAAELLRAITVEVP
jgi:hypothetical protein